MRIDLSDLDRLTGIAAALERLFWCLLAVGLLAAVLGSPGTGIFALVLGAVSFVVRAGLEDFVRSRREAPADRPAIARSREGATPEEGVAPNEGGAPEEGVAPKAGGPRPDAEPELRVYRAPRRLRRAKSPV